MVRNNIKIFARIKQERNREASAQYEIVTKQDHEYLIVRNPVSTEECPKSKYKFRFLNIFDQGSSQLDIYETIAKPIVDSVLNGFNATIFAYGQTGSGKTYAITGSSKDYSHRGIIPRSIEHVFEHAESNPHKYTIYISYLEIYNDAGYDLLSGRHRPSTHMEDLPKVMLLADGKGDYHLRNLSIHPVATVQDAMGLLFMGDSNRTIVETPMNDFSSRSHCVFTLYMSSLGDEGVIRRSKLHLVDLAGSERVYKSRVTGQTLTEAKYINLSLHYLEQVIVALSESKRPHVPFRNSMMTYMLKDSLAGNCLTSMLTTISVNLRDVQETITTCKFAQRVAMVNTNPEVNQEEDMQQQLDFLRRENIELRKQLCSLRTAALQSRKSPKKTKNKSCDLPKKKTKKGQRNSGSVDENYCKIQVQKFFNDTNNVSILDVRNHNEVEMCFSLMKQMYMKEKAVRQKSRSAETTSRELLNKYKTLVNQKDEEISVLNELVENLSRNSAISLSLRQTPPNTIETPLSDNDLFRAFALDPKNCKEIDQYNNAIRSQYTAAKQLSEVIENYRTDIRQLKHKLGNEAVKYDEDTKVQMNANLMRLVGCYLQTLLKIKNIKLKTDDLKQGLEQAHKKLCAKFKKCIQKNNLVSDGIPSQDMYLTSKKDLASIHDDISFPEKIITPRSRKKSIDSISSFVYKDIEDVSPTRDNTPILKQNTNRIIDNSPDLSHITSRSTTCRLESRSTFDQGRVSSLNLEKFGVYNNTRKEVSHLKTTVTKEDSFDIRDLIRRLNDEHLPPKPKKNDYVSNIEKEVCCESLVSQSSLGSQPENKANLSGAADQMIEMTLIESNPYETDSAAKGDKPNEPTKISHGHKHKHSKTHPAENKLREVHQDNPIQDLIERESQSTQVCDLNFLNPAVPETRNSISIVKHECVKRKAVVFLENDSDTEEFKEFMKTVPLTGDTEVDEEIYSFYRYKFKG